MEIPSRSFRYKWDPTKTFQQNSDVDHSLFEYSERILESILDRFGSADEYMSAAYGSEMMSGEELKLKVNWVELPWESHSVFDLVFSMFCSALSGIA